jgi:hypothetical protein
MPLEIARNEEVNYFLGDNTKGRVITALLFLLEGPYLVVVANRHKLTLTASMRAPSVKHFLRYFDDKA